MSLDIFFNPKTIAIVGVSRNPNKIGHIIFKNLIYAGFKEALYIVNPNAEEILDMKSYRAVTEIKEKVDLAIIAVPAESVIKVVEQCGKKQIKQVVIVSSGFSEIGNAKLEEDLKKALQKHKISAIGPNCLGIYDAYTKINTMFLPSFKMNTPKKGFTALVSQSGAVGSALLDLASKKGHGISKFISYGNAADIDESDILEYLALDENTKVISIYIEGLKNGKKFMQTAKRVSKIKPIIALKGGITEASKQATISHTGSLAGTPEIYKKAFKQAGIIEVFSLEDLFIHARVLERSIVPQGNRTMVITVSGGYGILVLDELYRNNIPLAEFSKESVNLLKKQLPGIATIANPLDLTGGAANETYKLAIETALNDKNIDIVIVVLLYQIPLLTQEIVKIISDLNAMAKKPILVVATGGDLTEKIKDQLEKNNVVCLEFPEQAADAVKYLAEYSKIKTSK